MNSTYKLVELVKEKNGINSDYAVAKMLNITSVKISEWKREKSEANAENTLKLIVAAGITAEEALKIMTQRPANSSGTLSHTAKQCILCKIKRHLRIRLIQDTLQTLSRPIVNIA